LKQEAIESDIETFRQPVKGRERNNALPYPTLQQPAQIRAVEIGLGDVAMPSP
jgi:hypothetical protein